MSTGSTGNGDNNILFPEFELVTEPEDYDQLDEEENRATEHQETKETTEVDDELDVEELEKMAMAESQDDRQFAKFKKRIQHEPDQVQYLCNLFSLLICLFSFQIKQLLNALQVTFRFTLNLHGLMIMVVGS